MAISPEFMQYFENQWYKQHPNWFLGSSEPGEPSANNGMESFNSAFKRVYTFRERLPPADFVNCLTKVIHDFSMKYRNLYSNRT